MEAQKKVKNKDNETVKAGCVVLNENEEVLLVSNNKGEIWAFPKGHSEEGETLEQSALREVKEETGYEVEILKRLSDVSYAHGQTGELIRVAMFKAKPVKEVGSMEKDIQSKWVTIEEAKKIIYSDLAQLLNEIV